MGMAMVQVGPVRMAMNQGFMGMNVCMLAPRRRGVRVTVMPIVMFVFMLMRGLDVPVHMRVPITEQQNNRSSKDQGCRDLEKRQGFMQPQHGEQYAEKWRCGKDHLSARGTDPLSGTDVEGNA